MPDETLTPANSETHIDKIEVDGGCEIGPKMGHPHFHLLLTVNHFSYVQFDYFKMNTFLEIMFRGLETFHGWGRKYMLPGGFYGDSESPYVDSNQGLPTRRLPTDRRRLRAQERDTVDRRGRKHAPPAGDCTAAPRGDGATAARSRHLI